MTPPLRPRPLWIALSGLGMLAAAAALFVAVVATHLGGYPHWSDDSVVPVDGRAHRVAVDGDRPLMVWVDESVGPPTCTARHRTGAEVPTDAPDGTYRREGGAADWAGTTVLRPSAGPVEVTCGGLHPTTRGVSVMVESVPRGPAFLAGDCPEVWIAVGLAGTGVLALLAAILLAVRPLRR